MSKFDQNRTRRLRKTLHKQTERKTNRHYENNGHLAVNQQVVKVISHKAASAPRTGGSVVFARWRQCTSSLLVAYTPLGMRTERVLPQVGSSPDSKYQ